MITVYHLRNSRSERAQSRGHLAGMQHLLPYLARMTARDAYQRAKQKAA